MVANMEIIQWILIGLLFLWCYRLTNQIKGEVEALSIIIITLAQSSLDSKGFREFSEALNERKKNLKNIDQYNGVKIFTKT